MDPDVKQIEDMIGVVRCEKCGKERCKCSEEWHSRSLTAKEIAERMLIHRKGDPEKRRKEREGQKRFDSKMKSKFNGRR